MNKETIFPSGHHLRNAVKWISEEKKNQKNISSNSIIEKAGVKFNLSPKDVDFLIRTLIEQKA